MFRHMGSDLGHDEEVLFPSVTTSAWSKKEKEFLRVLLSNRVGSALVWILMELMIYSYSVLFKNDL